MLNALVQRGFDVLVPFGEGQPYDLVVHVPPKAFFRVQCKTAWRRGGCAIFNCRTTDHGRGPLAYVGLADLFGVYFPPRKAVYLVPIGAVPDGEGRLRIEPARNNQRRRTRPAAGFEVERWTVEALRGVAGSATGSPKVALTS